MNYSQSEMDNMRFGMDGGGDVGDSDQSSEKTCDQCECESCECEERNNA